MEDDRAVEWHGGGLRVVKVVAAGLPQGVFGSARQNGSTVKHRGSSSLYVSIRSNRCHGGTLAVVE